MSRSIFFCVNVYILRTLFVIHTSLFLCPTTSSPTEQTLFAGLPTRAQSTELTTRDSKPKSRREQNALSHASSLRQRPCAARRTAPGKTRQIESRKAFLHRRRRPSSSTTRDIQSRVFFFRFNDRQRRRRRRRKRKRRLLSAFARAVD